jgi:hypothetical protein
VRPLEQLLLHVVAPVQKYDDLRELYSTHMWVSPKGSYTSEQLSGWLKTELSNELGIGFGIADVRHIMIGFFRKEINTEVAESNLEYAHILETIADHQAGHTPEISQAHYAGNMESMSDVPESVLKEHIVVSEMDEVAKEEGLTTTPVRQASYGMRNSGLMTKPLIHSGSRMRGRRRVQKF